jgi:hypothetical protein
MSFSTLKSDTKENGRDTNTESNMLTRCFWVSLFDIFQWVFFVRGAKQESKPAALRSAVFAHVLGDMHSSNN